MSDVTLSKAVRTNLLSLQNTAQLMEKTQQRLATGNKVNSALDNPSNFFTASALNSRAGDLNSLIDNMANGVKTIEAADNGLTSITKTLESMQSTLRQARQDKSFQVDTYEVGAKSTLKVNGGQFGDLTEIKLQEPSGGTKAELTFAAAYAEPAAAAADVSTAAGAGGRAIISYVAANFTGTSKIKIDGKEYTFNGTNSPSAAATSLTSALGGAGANYTVTANSDDTALIIEAKDKTAASPVVELGAGITAATYGETSFIYNAAYAGMVEVGGQTIATTGSSFNDFVASLQDKAEDGGYSVHTDAATQKITLRSVTPGTAEPTITGLNETHETYGKTVFNLTGAALTVPANSGDPANTLEFTIDNEVFTLSVAHGGNALANGSQVASALNNQLPTSIKNKYNITVDGANITFTHKTAGESTVATTISAVAGGSGATGPTTTNWNTNPANWTPADTTGITVSRTPGAAGAATTYFDAAAHKFTVTYGTKSADINIVGRDANSATPKEDQLKLINDQLKAAGLQDLTATFDADNKLVISANTPEAKTLAVSGDNVTLFGSKTAVTGAAAISAYKATSAVDQFVEEINRNPATSSYLRASNDNGKLRIENLSTQKLDVEFDKDGAGGSAPTNHTIGGNTVREGFAKQFNELKDQLNKLADDASFNGINLLRGDQLTITFNETGSSVMKIQAGDNRGVNSQSLNISDLTAIQLDSDLNIDGLLNSIKVALNSVRSQASAFGSNLSIVQNRQDFTKNMINTLQSGASNLTLADMNEEAANLLALQTRQSLSSSALSMASQADQNVLQLLR